MSDKHEHEFEGFATRSIHGGFHGDEYGSVIPPIVQSSTYKFRNTDHGAQCFKDHTQGYIYTRLANPTIDVLERNVASLEGGADALACSTGIGAVNTLFFALLNAGDHIVMSESIYAPTRINIERHWSRFGVEFSFVDSSDADNIRAAMKPNTRMVFIETPANPAIAVTDIAAAAAIAHGNGCLLAVDNTVLSPVLQRPIEHGADIVVHSITKSLNGHSDVVGGIIVFAHKEHYKEVHHAWYHLGATMDPHQAWLVIRGLKTLELRVKQMQKSAKKIAKWLEKHPKVKRVHYLGLKSHPQRELNEKQASGPGSLMSFELKGGLEAGKAMMDAVRLCSLAVSLGGVDTLIQHPASMTHVGMTSEERQEAGIPDGMVRFSIGCETTADIIADLEQALARV
ncbi:MAG: PLP-dependent transferase [Planctomycetales bacterium]|nr:PLP-dependent transferase [bacterium]UNM08766.1 MAG: PLP-dependent transferase [Planctomycetales bacterium]